MIKNVIKYSIAGLLLSFAFSAITIYFIKQRDDIVLGFPENWQLMWFFVINCVGFLSQLIARWLTPAIVKWLNKNNNNKKFIAITTISSTAVSFIGMGIGYSLILINKISNILFLALYDIILFSVLMLFTNFFMYLIFEYKYIFEKQKNEESN